MLSDLNGGVAFSTALAPAVRSYLSHFPHPLLGWGAPSAAAMGICWANGERLVIANADGTLSEVLAGEARSPATTRLALAGHALFTRSDGAGLAECARAYRAALLEAAEGAEEAAEGGGGGEDASQLYAAHVVWEFCEAVYLSDGTFRGSGGGGGGGVMV